MHIHEIVKSISEERTHDDGRKDGQRSEKNFSSVP